MDFQRIKKAYWVGTKDDLRSINMPWCGAQMVYVKEDETANHAKYRAYDINVPYVERHAKRCKQDDLYFFENREFCLNVIKQTLNLRQWRKDMEKLVSENIGALVYIYSGQWGAFWGTNYCGYTTCKESAGIYDIKDAWEHTSHCGLEKQIKFIFV